MTAPEWFDAKRWLELAKLPKAALVAKHEAAMKDAGIVQVQGPSPWKLKREELANRILMIEAERQR